MQVEHNIAHFRQWCYLLISIVTYSFVTCRTRRTHHDKLLDGLGFVFNS